MTDALSPPFSKYLFPPPPKHSESISQRLEVISSTKQHAGKRRKWERRRETAGVLRVFLSWSEIFFASFCLCAAWFFFFLFFFLLPFKLFTPAPPPQTTYYTSIFHPSFVFFFFFSVGRAFPLLSVCNETHTPLRRTACSVLLLGCWVNYIVHTYTSPANKPAPEITHNSELLSRLVDFFTFGINWFFLFSCIIYKQKGWKTSSIFFPPLYTKHLPFARALACILYLYHLAAGPRVLCISLPLSPFSHSQILKPGSVVQ